jgi:hypothetical protein
MFRADRIRPDAASLSAVRYRINGLKGFFATMVFFMYERKDDVTIQTSQN